MSVMYTRFYSVSDKKKAARYLSNCFYANILSVVYCPLSVVCRPSSVVYCPSSYLTKTTIYPCRLREYRCIGNGVLFEPAFRGSAG